ncbi:hypothetical protein TKK_0013579 [Trichogramma kaykai]
MSKRVQRLQIKINPPRSLSPVSELKETLKESNLPKTLQNQMVTAEIFRRQFKSVYQSLDNNTDKLLLKKVTTGSIIKKY